jgi:putative oxidoreductase
MAEVAAAGNSVGTKQPGKVFNIILWVLQIAAAAMFLFAGAPKLLGAPQVVAVFETIGFGQWFRYLTGGLEIIGALLLLIPSLCGVGALLLTCVMVGAVGTHLFLIGGSPVPAIVLLLVMALIAWGRLDRTLRLLGRAR